MLITKPHPTLPTRKARNPSHPRRSSRLGVRAAIERFIAGEPWRGTSEETAILEVPEAGYGRLRLTASDRERFTEEDIDTLQEFVAAIALGYARYLDFQQLEEQN